MQKLFLLFINKTIYNNIFILIFIMRSQYQYCLYMKTNYHIWAHIYATEIGKQITSGIPAESIW